MQGSGSEYIPMIPSSPGRIEREAKEREEEEEAEEASGGEEKDESEAKEEENNDNKDCPVTITMETDENEAKVEDENPDSPTRPKNLTDTPDGLLSTQAMVHNNPRQSPTNSSQNSSPDDTFLSRSDSDRSDKIPPRCRTRYMCNDSVTSETSSGFHSDYQPEDSGTIEYSQVLPKKQEEVALWTTLTYDIKF